MQWFRMYAEFLSDPVVQSLAFEDQRHYVAILCLKCNGTLDRELLPKARDRIIHRGIGLDPINAQEAKRRLIEVGLIDKKWQPKGWEKRQYKSDDVTQRTRKYRNEKETGNVPETSQEQLGNAPDTEQNRTDTDLSFPNGKEGKAKASPCPQQAIVDLYHETLPTLPRVVRLTPARQQQIRCRWQEGNQDLDGWRKFFEHVAESDFLMGRTKPRADSSVPFVADLEWLTKAANWIKVIEGKYHHG